MMRIIALIVAAAVVLIVASWLAWSVIHFLVVAFWIVLILGVGMALFRMGRRSSRRAR